MRRSESVLADRPLDALLASIGDSFGAAGLGVVLTGMGDDGASGAAALRAAGGVVIAQSEDTAEQPAMPRAAAAADAVDLVLPLHEIGPALVDAALGRRLPVAPMEAQAIRHTFGRDGVMAAQAAEMDWSRTLLGPVTTWSPTLRSVVRQMMGSPEPVFVFWGAHLLWFSNEAARAFMPGREADLLGRSLPKVIPEAWEQLRPHLEPVLAGHAVRRDATPYVYQRGGRLVRIWANVVDAPIWEQDGTVAGVHRVIQDRTDEVLSARRLTVLDALAQAPRAAGRREALAGAMQILGDAADLLFSVAYLFDQPGTRAGLVAATEVEEGGPMAPLAIRLVPGAAWPLHELTEPLVVDDLASRFPGHLLGADELTPEAALVHPLRDDAEDRVVGVLILGLDPYLDLDDRYREFLLLVGDAVAGRMTEAHARQRERQRLDRLAELDRAKTEFFSNVSHEFRTPLTLMLGPLEELLREDDGLSQDRRADLDLIRRNAHRLLRLVGTMLDFSQIEAGRLRAHFTPVDLGKLTREIAGQFESAAAQAGLRLRLDLEELPEPVWVDAEMWEKILSNLLSNALKFTFEGEIEVTLRGLPQHAELVVRDTGVGIADGELPHIFKRFHRVRGTRARSEEGAGIGLALVDELVRRHHGRIRAASALDKGTTFTVWLPFGRRPASPEAPEPLPRATAVAAAMAEEASQWGAGREPPSLVGDDDDELRRSLRSYAPGARVLVADDNKDMREYLTRLLSPQWEVEAASDGTEALEHARATPPDLVLADVMMPGLDGFALLRELRDDAALRAIPVVLVTARAGEEAAIEGLLAGADDYIVKPFSARELVARVGGQLGLARARRRNQELNAFLVRFSDAVRGLADAALVARTACQMILDQLGGDRAYWSEVDWSAREWVTVGESHGPMVSAIEGRYPMDAWEPGTSWLLEGRSYVIDDMQTDARVPPSVKEISARLQMAANVAVPVLVDGTARCVLAIDQRRPRRWSADEIALVEGVAVRCWGEVERARAEAALRESEDRQAFLLELTDALRSIADPLAVQETAGRMTSEHLGIGRVAYCEIRSEPDVVVVVDHDWPRRGMPATPAGRDRMDDFGSVLAVELTAGRPAVVEDARTDSRLSPAERANWSALEIVAQCALPVTKDGRFVAYLAAQDDRPHVWTEGQIALLAEVSERTWAAVERARAEAALRASEQRQTFLLALSDALRPLPDASAIKATGARMLGEHLDVSRAFYSEMAGDEWIIDDVFERDVAPLPRGGYPAETYGRWTMDTLRADRIVSVADTGGDARLRPTERRALQSIGVGAVVGVPLMRAGHIVAVLSLHSREPRDWTDEELELVQETADRTWPAVERVRAEAELRASEGRQAFLLDLSDALGPLADAAEFGNAAARLLGEHLGATRALYAEVDGVASRRGTKAAVLADHDRLRTMVDTRGIGVLTWETARGTLVDANEVFLEMSGYSREQIEAGEVTWRRITAAQHIAETERQLARLTRTGRIGPYEKDLVRADGSRWPMLFAGAAISDRTAVEYCIDLRGHARAEARRRVAATADGGSALAEDDPPAPGRDRPAPGTRRTGPPSAPA